MKIETDPSTYQTTLPSHIGYTSSITQNIEQTVVNQWLREAIAGSIEAFEELYRLYSRQIFSYCKFRVGNLADAEDLTAQVFLKAWQSIRRYKVGSVPFLSWLYRIAHNLVANHYRSMSRNQEVADAGLDVDLIESFEDKTAIGADPIEVLLKQSRNNALRRALKELTEEQQQVLYFRFVEDWSHSQIASFLGKKENSIRGLQFRGLARLGKILNRDLPDDRSEQDE